MTTIGILTAGGDAPGLNAAIRAIGKSALISHDMHVIGFREGFRGLMQNRFIRLGTDELSGILIRGGTVLGTSRAKVHKMDVGNGERLDMRPMMKKVTEQHQIDALVCLGGGGTIKNAYRLEEVGVPVLALPKTIDNDIWGTDATFGFDTALNIATEAIDRLHSTAHSHHRIVVVEIMGHNTGWLALGSGIAGGADVILIPEIPYDEDSIAEAILSRKAAGNPFSIVAIAEGAMSRSMTEERDRLKNIKKESKDDDATAASEELDRLDEVREDITHDLASALELRTGLESRVTILGHVQRGGTPSPRDRLLATRLGTACVDLIADGVTGVLVASENDGYKPIPLAEVAGKRKSVPLDHRWIGAARSMGINLGD
ncbi:MAG: ATP-dependent 6-phosphofructokinase [Acidimicrobiia bacterium]|nr:ATP-dependent 6-phosphofructokinase [Acidimicrobiia bacterium]